MNSSRITFLVSAIYVCAMTPACKGADNPGTFRNSVGMKLVRIEPGGFTMGREKGGDWDERPTHKVTIARPFHIGATEVTNSQYERFDPSHREQRGRRGISKGDNEAVVFVSWAEAVKFCEWLSNSEGELYRLPTEAEWEYACRAGTKTPFHTGQTLPTAYHKNQEQTWEPMPAKLHVGRTPANAWGLHDMHGNVEEWCHDWYGSYTESEQTDPVGRAEGDFKVTRGGSYDTEVEYLRSANRMGTLPEDKHWLLGFRVVMGELPNTKPLHKPAQPLWASDVNQSRHDWSNGPDPSKPYFRGPREYVKIPANSDGPMFSKHNHCPGITACPNGDLLAVWYSTRTEQGRELAIVASRLRRGDDEWEPAAPFWDVPDRNDHASALWWDGRKTIYHFNGLSSDATWGKLALIVRTSTDNGVTWSKARLINAKHGLRNMPIAGVFQTRDGCIVLPCDAATGGDGGTAVHLSRDNGKTWIDPGAGRPNPKFSAGQTGAWIAGIHAGVAEIAGGRLIALGRGDSIDGQMPRSISTDMGQTWAYSASGLPPIGGGQRLVLLRLREGPLFLASFAEQTTTDATGETRNVSGLFGALSFDDGETWPVRRLITDDGPSREVDGGGNTRRFTLGPNSAEPRGYMACTQTLDRVIQLISSKQHYEFNLAWVKEPMPVETK